MFKGEAKNTNKKAPEAVSCGAGYKESRGREHSVCLPLHTKLTGFLPPSNRDISCLTALCDSYSTTVSLPL